MASSLKLKPSFRRLKSLLHFQRFNNHTFVKGGLEAEFLAELGPKAMPSSGRVDASKWKKVDSRTLGVTQAMIPDSSRIVLRILQNEGHDAYLVGGCVRDLILNKTPKDFDVVTSANLQQIKKQFHRAYIVGRRFPICMVHVRGSVVEVSSFETVANDVKKKKEIHKSDTPKDVNSKDDTHMLEIPKGYDKKDLMRWKNSLHRDFTINSLFYDPFAHKIYDYSSGIADLTSMKLRTLVPAHLSFQEDCARVLRGLRIAARLRLSFAKDTEKAISKSYESVATLDKGRLMLEMNYMLSYGAAEPSLLLLKQFNLLGVLLPFQAAYLANQSGAQTPVMLTKLFFNLDNVVSCDQPCDSGLWVSLLAFHLALVNNPQDALVVWTFSSVLYHGKWKEGVKAARELAKEHVRFMPEILESSSDITDGELAERVFDFGSTVLESIDALTESESLLKAMSRYPGAPCSGLVFISKNAGREAAKVFDVLVDDIASLENESRYYDIDYRLLAKGDTDETRFVLGKVIMDTLRAGVTQCQKTLVTEKENEICVSRPKPKDMDVKKPNSTVEIPKSKAVGKRGLDVPDDQLNQPTSKRKKKNKTTASTKEKRLVREKLVDMLSCQDIANKKQQLKKVVVKDVRKLLSLQKKASQKDGKLETGEGCKARGSKGIAFVQEIDAAKELQRVLEKAPETAKEEGAQASNNLLSVLATAPKVRRQHNGESPAEMHNLVNIFNGEKELVKKPVKEKVVGEQSQQGVGKLSSLFK